MAVTLRIENVPEEVAARLEERAKKSRRSLQGELLRILEKAAAQEGRLTAAQILEKVRSLKLKTPADFAYRRAAKKKDIVQVKNPKSGHYVKIDRSVGKIIAHKKSGGPYKDVPIARHSG